MESFIIFVSLIKKKEQHVNSTLSLCLFADQLGTSVLFLKSILNKEKETIGK